MTEETTNTKRGVPVWVQVVIWAFLVGLLGLVGFGLNRARNPMAEIGKPVPDFDIVYYEGYEYDSQPQMKLSDLQGKIVLINIWASWCKPCEQEAPELEEAWQFYKNSNDVVFIGVDYVDTPAGANEYLTKFNITFPNAPDLQSTISSILNRQMGVPETYIIDREGVLRHIKIGPFASVDEIKSIIQGIE
ncbi:MAG TPA: TlpA disulfide reductase family protein [Anaerolineales bacterium]|nr:TlpA disulfide reductase family protein [Anaerolineales bacterium]HMV97710.1 TlpA disulfide reductase family protein [Anaerolineales bacterium]HMX19793.1 TlpA disulfide reductase family protein [Anaerolineales bacterium]HMX73698.1 TlpA disulfide reductase family protein [Anaerolineales bacterium]HMZ42107.1 TlpA disulfide reductase family protein [Anaerolineales bacterium]